MIAARAAVHAEIEGQRERDKEKKMKCMQACRRNGR